jgi:hypothetical protein
MLFKLATSPKAGSEGRLFDPLVVRRFAPNNQRILLIRSGHGEARKGDDGFA